MLALRALVAVLGVWLAVAAHADTSRRTLPEPYQLSQLRRDLSWVDAAVAPEALASAYRAYLFSMNPLVSRAALEWSRADDGSADQTAAERKVQKEYDRALADADAAEDGMWDALILACEKSPDVQAKLSRIKEFRSVERLVKSATDRASTWERRWRIPGSAFVELQNTLGSRALDPGARQALIQIAADRVNDRRTKWRSLVSELGGSSPQQRIEAATTAVREIELATLRALLAVLPADIQAAGRERFIRVAGVEPVTTWRIPGCVSWNVDSVRELGQKILGSRDISNEQRAAARTILAEWIVADEKWIEQEAAIPTPAEGSPEFDERNNRHDAVIAMAKGFVAKLHQATGLAWLHDTERLSAPKLTELQPLTQADADLVGPLLPAPAAERTNSLLDSEMDTIVVWRALPRPLPESVRRDMLNAVANSPEFAAKIESLWSAYQATWRDKILPEIRLVSQPYEACVSGAPRTTQLKAWRAAVAGQPRRKAVWEAAKQAEEQLVVGLEQIAVPGAARCKALLALEIASRRLEGLFDAVRVSAFGHNESAVNVYEVLRALPATPEERDQILKAASPLVGLGAGQIDALTSEAVELVGLGDANNVFAMEVFSDESGQFKSAPPQDRKELEEHRRAVTERGDECMRRVRALGDQVVKGAESTLGQELSRRIEQWRAICGAVHAMERFQIGAIYQLTRLSREAAEIESRANGAAASARFRSNCAEILNPWATQVAPAIELGSRSQSRVVRLSGSLGAHVELIRFMEQPADASPAANKAPKVN